MNVEIEVDSLWKFKIKCGLIALCMLQQITLCAGSNREIDVNSTTTSIIMTTLNISDIASLESKSTDFYSTDCAQDPNCQKCGSNGCIKCTKLILNDSRKCVDICPSGYSEPQWSMESDLMGRVCKKAGITSSVYAVLIGTLCGVILCLLLVLVGVFIFRRKQRKFQRKTIKESLIDEEYDKNEFFKQLDELRPQAEYFLHMLNDTRKQVRKLHLSGDNAAAAKYYPIIRDLAKILILLNRPVELIIGPPHDWKTLLMWAERILSQYKPQITQLIEFLQTPAPTPIVDARLTFSKHTTFKTPPSSISKAKGRDVNDGASENAKDVKKRNSLGSSNSKPSGSSHLSLPNDKNIIGSLISLQDFDSILQPSNPFGDSFNHVQTYLSTTSGTSATHLTGSTLLLEEEFFKLGFRPQDEITTEL